MSDSRISFLSPQQMYALDLACIPIRRAFQYGPYLVGSVNTRRDYRDVDVRCIVTDDDPVLADAMRVKALNFMVSQYLGLTTGLPVDFQFQSQSEAAEHDGFRNPLGTRWVTVWPDDDPTPIHADAMSVPVREGQK